MVQDSATAELPDSAEKWGGLIASLESDREAVAAELASVEAQARPLAIPAATGSKEATRALVQLDARAMELGQRTRRLAAALEDAAQHRDAAAAAERVKMEEARLEEARELGAQVVAAAEKADTAFAALVTALRERATLVARLGAYGISSRRLANPSYVSGAAAAAGLRGLLDLGVTVRSMTQPLADTDAKLLGSLLPAVSATPAPLPVPPPGATSPQAGNPDRTEAERRRAEREADAAEVARARAHWRENPPRDDREVERRRSWLASKGAA